jgi:hypothetical protein
LAARFNLLRSADTTDDVGVRAIGGPALIEALNQSQQ